MVPADDADTAGEKSTFRWLDAARYALAVVVTVFIVTVIAHAITVVLRSEKPQIYVVGGFISVNRSQGPTPADQDLSLTFTLRAVNPSGRVRVYFIDINGTFVIKNATVTSPPQDLSRFPLQEDMALNTPTQELQEHCQADVKVTQVHGWRRPYFDLLYNESDYYIPDAMLRLNGTVITEVYSGYNKTDLAPTVFCCSPLTIGGDPAEHTAVDDVRCDPYDQTCYSKT